MLCDLAHSFPPYAAKLLERDRGLRRNFREESVTDVLMASLIGLKKFGIRVDFPDEPTTGGDMDWIFAAPKDLNGGRYLRLLLQAKRARYAKLMNGGYWYYAHLDHGDPKGSQAKQLLTYANSGPDGMNTCPLYILYHPTSALNPASGALPEILGVNLIFADTVAPIVAGGCGKAKKRVDYWRPGFLSLSDILCWPTIVARNTAPGVSPEFIADLYDTLIIAGFHPDDVAKRLNRLRDRTVQSAKAQVVERQPVISSERIPAQIMRGIIGETTKEDRKALKRPRVIFSTPLTRRDQDT
jgi:hypothetical protein